MLNISVTTNDSANGVAHGLSRKPLLIRERVDTCPAYDDLADAHPAAALTTHGRYGLTRASGHQAGLGFVEGG